MYAKWPCPLPDGSIATESALAFDRGRTVRLLMLVPLFDEANKTRHQIFEIMRRLDLAGFDSVLPDLPGCNESLADPAGQTLAHWRIAAESAAAHFGCTHVFAVRSGSWLAPITLPGWAYAPPRPGSVLRAMIRARILATREAGRAETADSILLQAREVGTVLGGWKLGPGLISELEEGTYVPAPLHTLIEHATIGGPPLWLRAEPDDDPEQADILAGLLAVGLVAQ